ncbi:MAG: trypsin-like serine protease [Myxococcales bacterium]|nr:trypsin-like serine protease [Myxococcales bacterium]
MKLSSTQGRTACLGLFLLLGVGGCAPADDAETPSALAQARQAIRGGQPDSEHTSVVGILIGSGWQQAGCTGSLIAPNLVLTAHHCVAPTPPGGVICGRATFGANYRPQDFEVTTRPYLGRQPYPVAEVITPPGVTDLCGGDIALLRLARNIPATESVPYTPRIDRQVAANERYDAVGYGEIGDGTGAGLRRIITGRQVICSGSTCARFGAPVRGSEWIGNDGVCQGDSGGPALDDQGRVLGALSRGGDGCSYPVYSGVFGWSDWLREQGARAADLGGYAPAAWVVSGASSQIDDADDDGVADGRDNCVNAANPEQGDLDGDGLGDACDDADGRDRGGRCAVCDACSNDADCTAGARCVDFGAGGVCTYDCSVGTCPGDTTCAEMSLVGGDKANVCINGDAWDVGVCHADFVCGGPREAAPAEACRVCDACRADADCGAGGACLDFGAGNRCTVACGEDGACPGDSVCADVDGLQVCVAPGEAGVCPTQYSCGEAPAPGADGGEPGGDGVMIDRNDPFAENDGILRSKSDDGCAAAPGRSGNPLPFAAFLVLGLGLAVRRRRG